MDWPAGEGHGGGGVSQFERGVMVAVRGRPGQEGDSGAAGGGRNWPRLGAAWPQAGQRSKREDESE